LFIVSLHDLCVTSLWVKHACHSFPSCCAQENGMACEREGYYCVSTAPS
jgi:hypothetical protein